jgi:CheY-like chemotaxis protein
VVIDDNQDATATLRDVLELEVHHVVAAFDVRSGIDAALNARADVVLCVVGLPDIDGFEVARRLRAAGLRSRLVALTGYARPDDAQRALLAGFDDHLAEPADPDALMALLASAPVKDPAGTD